MYRNKDNLDTKLEQFETNNASLRNQIRISRRKRAEASNFAKKLAESNFYLKNSLREAWFDLQELRRKKRNLKFKSV